MLFKAALSPSSVSTGEKQPNTPLDISILAITPGTMLPLRNEEGVAVAQFEATEDLIKGAVQRSRGGLLTVDHEDPIESRIGVFTSVSYNDGFLATGQILCPKWIEIVAAGEEAYSGLSVEGSITGDDLEHPESIDVYCISLLTNEKTPEGGACGRGSCKIIVDDPEDADDESIETEASIEAAWNPNYSAFWNYIETDGKINQTKAKKIFLKKTGDGANRGDWHYPIARMTDNGPVPDEEGLMAAYKRAAQQGETSLFSKIRSKMRSIGMEVPPGLTKAKLDASFDKETGTFSAKLSDEDGEIVSESKITIIDEIGEDKMPKKELKADEAPEPIVEASASTIVEEVAEPEIAAASPDVGVEAPPVETVAAEAPVAAPVVEPTINFWELAKNELGISSLEEFEQIRDTATKVDSVVGQITSLTSEIGKLQEQNEVLAAFKVETEKRWLQDTYPPAVVKDIAAAHAEFVSDPATFVQKYQEDAIKFAAAKDAKFMGSAAESKDTETARMEARKAKRDEFLRRTGGPVIK